MPRETQETRAPADQEKPSAADRTDSRQWSWPVFLVVTAVVTFPALAVADEVGILDAPLIAGLFDTFDKASSQWGTLVGIGALLFASGSWIWVRRTPDRRQLNVRRPVCSGLVAGLCMAVVVGVGMRLAERPSAGAASGRTGITESAGQDRPDTWTDDPHVERVFEFPMRGGHAYDLDVDPGRAPVINGGGDAVSDDLYRSGGETELIAWQVYAPRAPKRDKNPAAFQVMDEQAMPADCGKTGAVATRGDSFDATLTKVGAQACVTTSEGHRLMIIMLSRPRDGDPFLRIRVAVLRPR
ncbi:hypothetical protein ACTOB_002673 [Actinoplanes oblitus]|uniref:Uncharacterized protein n=1 Tax=Actinoplanes oblitus TaxID=3040509 RepID=A0ABY8WMG4_9ACTN|nr:hypothetical protein [Actinoplanes oblitus]WIM99040.1 hypothetical protein ACTOB_002673 [Actinoplanes oblitus]